MITSETTKEIIPAMLEVSKLLINIEKNKDNPFFKSKYADLPSLIEMIKPELSNNGLFVVQEAPIIEGKVCISTKVFHRSGEWIMTEIHVFPNKNDAQGIGGAITYGRRYALLALLNMGQADDDGNSGRSKKKDSADSKLEIIRLKSEIFSKAKELGLTKDADKMALEKFIKEKTQLDLKEENYNQIIQKLNGSQSI